MIKKELEEAYIDEINNKIENTVLGLLELGWYKPKIEIVINQMVKRSVYKER